MIRERVRINGSEVVLLNEGDSAGWESSDPIRCSVCRAYSSLVFHFMFEDGDEFICFPSSARNKQCVAQLAHRMKFMVPDHVRVRSIHCPAPTPSPEKAARRKERAALSYKLRWQILKRDSFRCVKCGETVRLEVDHIEPISRGGKTVPQNLQTLCYPCNRGKGDEPPVSTT